MIIKKRILILILIFMRIDAMNIDNLNNDKGKNKIGVIGSGYVGLVTGACLASYKNFVMCADIDQEKINKLKSGIISIYEPGLKHLVKDKLRKGYIDFTNDIEKTIIDSDVIFIAVATPTLKNGESDLTAVNDVLELIKKNSLNNKIICMKSTVPVNTHKYVEDFLGNNFEIVSIPEFLREGSSINDFLNPDRIVIGTKSDEVFNKIKDIYSHINCPEERIIKTDNLSAELIKYASNSFLALKVSFINEIANFCDAIGADVTSVANGIGLDKRIGPYFLNAGPGFGGSCFHKDITAFIKMAKDLNIDLKLMETTLEVNEFQQKKVVEKLSKLMQGDLAGKTISVLGLAFKGNTDDIRKSPAINIIKSLQELGAFVKAYDPKAMENMSKEIPGIIYCENEYEAVKDCDAILILTEWDNFKNLDFEKISGTVKQKIVLDSRNILDIDKLNKAGFICDFIGRSYLQNHYTKEIMNKINTDIQKIQELT